MGESKGRQYVRLESPGTVIADAKCERCAESDVQPRTAVCGVKAASKSASRLGVEKLG